MDNQDYYGAPGSNQDSKSLRERLRELYELQDFVTVINVDTDPVRYQFTSPADLETYSDSSGFKDTVQHKVPQVVILKPGETKLCPAYEADLMIENLVKQIAHKRTMRKVESGQLDPKVASTNWSDPFLQQDLIKQIFLGKRDLVASYNESMMSTTALNVEKDLNLDEPQERARVGRPRKA